jgi:hypothetical protein
MLAVAVACSEPTQDSVDVCTAARNTFYRCGSSLPLLTDRPCLGIARAVSRCVVNHVVTCDDLAKLATRADECIADEMDGGELPPAEDLIPAIFLDASALAVRDAADANARPLSPDAMSPDAMSLDATSFDAAPVDASKKSQKPDAAIMDASKPDSR